MIRRRVLLMLASCAACALAQPVDVVQQKIVALLEQAERLRQSGSTNDVEKPLIEAVRQAERPDVPRAYLATAANRLGTLYRDAGQPQNAETYYLKALPAARAWGEQHEVQVTNNLAALYLETGQYRKASRLPLHEMLERVPYGPDAIRTKSNLAGLAANEGRVTEAEELLLIVLDEVRTARDTRNEANTLNVLGLLSLEQGRFEQAVKRLEPAAALIRARPDTESIVKVRVTYNLGVAYLRAARRSQAATAFHESAAYLDRWMAQDRPAPQEYFRLLADRLRETGDKTEAKRLQAKAPSGVDRAGFLVDVSDLAPSKPRR